MEVAANGLEILADKLTPNILLSEPVRASDWTSTNIAFF
jgi:hypothetical protein